MARLQSFFRKSHGTPRVDDRLVLSGIVLFNRNRLRWRDAPSEYGPHKTLYNRWKRWGATLNTKIKIGAARRSLLSIVREIFDTWQAGTVNVARWRLGEIA